MPRTQQSERLGLAEAFKRYCEENQRASKPGWRQMLRDLRRGVYINGVGTWRDVWRQQYEGETVPERCPQDWIPRGWKYENMIRKYKSTKFELVAMRKGAVAARQFAPPVYSTRVGLAPGRIYQFDDVWHDIKIAVPGVNKKLMRPLEFACIDVASTFKIGWGMKPQIQREDGSREGLGKAHFKALVAHILCNVGWHPDGCVFVIEHGTASLNEAEREMVTRLTDQAVAFNTSAILGKQVLKGMFSAKGKGNFKLKALLEGGHRLPHYEAAALPAQTGGLSRVDEPEQMYGIDRYSEKVLEAWERVPEDQRDLLWYGSALTLNSYRRIMAEIYAAIYSRKEHGIEGWEQNEWMVQEWSVDGRGDWRAAADIPALPEAMRQIGRIALESPGLSRLRRMSPAEVWLRNSAGLVKLPHWAVCDFLGDDCYRTVRVGSNGLIEFQDRDITGVAMKLRYAAVVQQPDGRGCRLAPGAQYGLYVLPYDLSKAVIVEANTRAVLGIVTQWSAVNPLNAEQVSVMQEMQERMIAAQEAPLRERHAERSEELVARREQNDLLLAGLTEPRKRRAGSKKQKVSNANAAMAALAQTRKPDDDETDGGNDGW